PVAVLLTTATILPGLLFALTIDLVPSQIGYARSAQVLSEADVRAIDWLRHEVSPGDLVYRNASVALGYGQWGGLPSPWVDAFAEAFAFGPQRIARRRAALDELPSKRDRRIAQLRHKPLRVPPDKLAREG